MKLIVGLGNPGRQYKNTKHNLGFMVLDELAKRKGLKFTLNKKFKGKIIQTVINNTTVILLKPDTFMNLSGEAVSLVKQFYQIATENILIVHDDLDLECGVLRVRQKGSSAGHKGLKSIINLLKSEDFHRLKIGIGRNEIIPVVDYVLSKLSKTDQKLINDAIRISIDLIEDWLIHDILYVMNKYNRKLNG